MGSVVRRSKSCMCGDRGLVALSRLWRSSYAHTQRRISGGQRTHYTHISIQNYSQLVLNQ
ncbi:hypothetical protein EON63_18555 [archaeon]|nr:MAG: hypothetical protein EON63_18555 [archaeon]